MASFSSAPVVGIFAIQGAVSEHSDCVKKCGGIVKEVSFHSLLSELIRKVRIPLLERLLWSREAYLIIVLSVVKVSIFKRTPQY
jgi:hypothetical protein